MLMVAMGSFTSKTILNTSPNTLQKPPKNIPKYPPKFLCTGRTGGGGGGLLTGG